MQSKSAAILPFWEDLGNFREKWCRYKQVIANAGQDPFDLKVKKEEFQNLLVTVSEAAFNFGKDMVNDELPTNLLFNVELNSSFDDMSDPKYDYYPADQDKIVNNLDVNQVVELLYRKGKVPVWIDISLAQVKDNFSVLRLICAGRYTNDLEEYYYHKKGTGPFGIKSPLLPIGHKEGTKFNLANQ